jgi:hypothetical protein
VQAVQGGLKMIWVFWRASGRTNTVFDSDVALWVDARAGVSPEFLLFLMGKCCHTFSKRINCRNLWRGVKS